MPGYINETLLCNNTINDILAIGIFFELEHDLILVRLLERNVVVSQFEILHGNTGPVKVKKPGLGGLGFGR